MMNHATATIAISAMNPATTPPMIGPTLLYVPSFPGLDCTAGCAVTKMTEGEGEEVLYTVVIITEPLGRVVTMAAATDALKAVLLELLELTVAVVVGWETSTAGGATVAAVATDEVSATGVEAVGDDDDALVQLANSVSVGTLRTTATVVTIGTRKVVCPPAAQNTGGQNLRHVRYVRWRGTHPRSC